MDKLKRSLLNYLEEGTMDVQYGSLHFYSMDRRGRARSILCDIVRKCTVSAEALPFGEAPASMGLCEKGQRPKVGGHCYHVRRLSAGAAFLGAPENTVAFLISLAKEADCPLATA